MDFLIFVVLVAAGPIGLYAHGWYTRAPREIRRLLRHAKRYRIGELPENKAGRVVGIANPVGEPLRAPLSGRACVYYHVKVSRAEQRARPFLLCSEQRGVAFSLVDDSGRAIVEPTNATVALVFDQKDMPEWPKTAMRELLARHDLPNKDFLASFHRYIYEEAVIEPGERVAVLGAGIREPDPDAEPEAEYRGTPRTRLRLTSSARWPLVISDDPVTQRLA